MIVSVIATIAYYALFLYLIALWARFILDLARNFARGWRPKGFLIVIAEIVFTITDPPIRTVRRVIPPIRLGGIALDFAWSIVLIAVLILMSLASSLTRVGV